MRNLFDSEDDAEQGQIQNEEQNDKIGDNNDIQDDKTQSDKDKKQKNQNKVTNDSIDKDSSKSKRQKQNSVINEDSDDFYSCTCKGMPTLVVFLFFNTFAHNLESLLSDKIKNK